MMKKIMGVLKKHAATKHLSEKAQVTLAGDLGKALAGNAFYTRKISASGHGCPTVSKLRG